MHAPASPAEVTHPDRLQHFLEETSDLQWDEAPRAESLQRVYASPNALFHAELLGTCGAGGTGRTAPPAPSRPVVRC